MSFGTAQQSSEQCKWCWLDSMAAGHAMSTHVRQMLAFTCSSAGAALSSATITMCLQQIQLHLHHHATQLAVQLHKPRLWVVGGTAKVELHAPLDGSKALRGSQPASSKSEADSSLRKGVAPGSFVDLLVRANHRGTEQKFTDTEIVSQVCCAALALLQSGRKAAPHATSCQPQLNC